MENNQEDIKTIIEGLTEAVLDQLIDDPFVKDIPLIGTAVSIARLGKSISDRIFIAKVKKFLLSVSVSQEEKEEFFRKLNSDEKLKSEAAEACLFIINRSDNSEKLSITGYLFQAFIKNRIDFTQFRKFIHAVDLAFVDDLVQFIKSGGTDRSVDDSLLRTGLTEMSKTAFVFSGEFAQSSVTVSELGKLFVVIMSDYPK